MQNKLKKTSTTTPPIAIAATSPVDMELDDGEGADGGGVLLVAGVPELDVGKGLRVEGLDGGGGGRNVLVDGDGEEAVGGNGVKDGDGADGDGGDVVLGDGGNAAGGGVDGVADGGTGGAAGGGDVVLVGGAGGELGAGVDILSGCQLVYSGKIQPNQIKNPKKSNRNPSQLPKLVKGSDRTVKSIGY